MKNLEFPHCCTASILVDFGESEVAEGGAKIYSVKEIEGYIVAQLNSYYNAHMAAVVVTTNSEQTRANAALRNLKFEHSTWMSKKQHRETKVRLWWKQIENKDDI